MNPIKLISEKAKKKKKVGKSFWIGNVMGALLLQE